MNFGTLQLSEKVQNIIQQDFLYIIHHFSSYELHSQNIHHMTRTSTYISDVFPLNQKLSFHKNIWKTPVSAIDLTPILTSSKEK